MRVDGWEKRLNATIKAHREMPSLYGVSDCFQICNDAVIAVTGEFLFKDVLYTSEKQAAKELLKRGFKTVEDAFASKLETIPSALAQRGDIGVIDDNGAICGGVFTALGFMVRNDNAVVFVPVSRVKTAFKVGR